MRRILPLVIVLFAVLLLPYVSGQQTYTIPLEGVAWDHTKITVQIQSSPTWAYDKVLAAMQVWNESQNWFRNTYLTARSPIYLLTTTHNAPDVTVQFSSQLVGGEYGGLTNWIRNGNVMTSARVILALLTRASLEEDVAIHEFGHVLGLWHVQYLNDIMNPDPDLHKGAMPSTLDLYAVHILIARGEYAPSPVTLPSSIPYVSSEQLPLPELPNTITLLTVVFCLTLNRIHRKWRERGREQSSLGQLKTRSHSA